MIFSNESEYFADTSHISSSMIKAYLKSPAYYKALYIDHSISKAESPAMEFGSALDCILTNGYDAFNEQYTYAVLKKDDPERFAKNKEFTGTVLSKGNYDLVFAACDALMATSAYQWIVDNKPVAQTILTGVIDGVKVKGKLDWLNIIDLPGKTVAVITDLKTTTNIHPVKFFYHSLDFMYDIQMAMYRELVRQNYEVDEVICQHLVVTKGDWPKVGTFTFNPPMLDRAYVTILAALAGITSQEYTDPDVSWEQAHVLDFKDESSQFIEEDVE